MHALVFNDKYAPFALMYASGFGLVNEISSDVNPFVADDLHDQLPEYTQKSLTVIPFSISYV